MIEQKQGELQQVFIPALPIQRITSRHALGTLQVAALKQPERICGIARRIGYTGKGDEDLTTYRLKIKGGGSKVFVTLPFIFVVENGVFLEYEAWYSNQYRSAGELTEGNDLR